MAPRPLWAGGCWHCPVFVLVYPDGFPASREAHLPLRVCLAGDFYLFFRHLLMNSIPKEANFLAASGGSGSGYKGGWDWVQRFDHGSCRSWALGAPGRRPLSHSFPLPPGGCAFFVCGGEVGWGHPSFFPQVHAERQDLAGLAWVFQGGPLSQHISALPTSLPSLHLPFHGGEPGWSQESSWVGGKEAFAMRMLVGGSIGPLWPSPLLFSLNH